MTINKIFLTGRLAKDPETRTFDNGSIQCKLTVVTDYGFKNKMGEQQKETCFIECIVWGVMAQHCSTTLSKGKLVSLEGRLKQENWVDKITEKERTKHTVIVNSIIFMEPKALKEDLPEGFEIQPNYAEKISDMVSEDSMTFETKLPF
jgi:single-strand DNA-binding protein